MDSTQLVIVILAGLVVAFATALLWAFIRSINASLSINAEWRESQRLRLDTDRAEFMLREARERDRTRPERLPPLRNPTAPDISTGPIE
jgi:hypothetical protein